MAVERLMQCRYCKVRDIDLKNQIKGVDYVDTNGKGYYIHMSCFKRMEELKNNPKSQAENSFWFEALKEYLAKDLKMSMNYPKLNSQWNNFLKKGFTAKGIYFAVKYFYDVEKNSTNSEGGDGIGIVPYIYEKSATYWAAQEAKQSGFLEKITQQLKEKNNQKIITVQAKKQEKTKSFINWDAIDSMSEDTDAS